jgi:hypothetical protein
MDNSSKFDTAIAHLNSGDAGEDDPVVERLREAAGIIEEAHAILVRVGAVGALLENLRGDSWQQREVACRALGELGDARAVGPLVARLYDEDWLIQRAACEALGCIGSAEALLPLADRLSDRWWVTRDAAREALERLLGTPVVDRTNLLQALAAIHQRTQSAANDMLCARCLLRFKETARKLGSLKTTRWFGCPSCGRMAVVGATHTLARIRRVLVVLDTSMIEPHVAKDGVLTANWLLRGSLFDFDSVEFVDAAEIDIDKFCVQVRNDTDLERKRRYKTMQCRVSNRLELRENTIRNLSAAFGEVVRV